MGGEKTKMPYRDIDRLREEIEDWVKFIGKRRTEELLGIKILNLEKSKVHSVVYA